MNEVLSVSLATAVDEYLRSKSKGTDSGNYRKNAQRELTYFLEWLTEQPGQPEHVADLDIRHLRRYARHLRTERNLARSSVLTYYAYVSGFLGWCVRERYLPQNPAQHTDAKEELPDDDGRRPGDQQMWSSDDRTRITRYVDQRAYEAVDERGHEAIAETRDRALVFVLCYAAIRGGELLRDPNDNRPERRGVTWGDVHLEDGSLDVYSKKQEWDTRALPSPARRALKAHERTLNPPSDDWPVFFSLHAPTLVRRAREGLSEQGHSDAAVEEILAENDAITVLREYEIPPLALTTEGGRAVMKRLCEGAGIELDDRHGYLTPHGGRRGAGEAMVRAKGVTAAARLLDNSEEMIRNHYSHIEAAELADEADEAFEQMDNSSTRD
jgi:integrase